MLKNIECIIIFLIVSMFFIAPVYGDDAISNTSQRENKQAERHNYGLFSAALSIAPGIVIHGSGLFSAGDTDAGVRLLIMEGAGLAMTVGGISVIAMTGASRYVTAPFYVMSLAGMGLFLNSWIADIYGAAGGAGGGPGLRADDLVINAGYTRIYDPVFEYRNFLSVRGDIKPGRFMITPSIDRALDDDNYRARLLGAYRILGCAKGCGTLDDAGFLEAEAAVTYHSYGTEKFAVWTGELFLNYRFDMSNIGASIRGSFMEGGFGYGIERYSYDIAGLEGYADVGSMLLMRFGYGLYLGNGDGEIVLYYDHRKDDFAAGLGIEGVGGGIIGHFGLKAFYYAFEYFGLYADVQIGAAFLINAGIMYRHF